MSSKGGRQSKISLKENGVVSFNSKNNANNFCRFFSNLADRFTTTKTSMSRKFGIKTTEDYYKQLRNEREDFALHIVEVTQPAFTCSKLTIETLEQGVK